MNMSNVGQYGKLHSSYKREVRCSAYSVPTLGRCQHIPNSEGGRLASTHFSECMGDASIHIDFRHLWEELHHSLACLRIQFFLRRNIWLRDAMLGPSPKCLRAVSRRDCHTSHRGNTQTQSSTCPLDYDIGKMIAYSMGMLGDVACFFMGGLWSLDISSSS